MTFQFPHKNKVFFFTAAIWAVLLSPVPAIALPCFDSAHNFANSVTPNIGCDQGTTNIDSAGQLNTDTLFGLSDWVLVDKDGPLLDGFDELTGSGDALSGTWEIAPSVFDDYATVALILKDGNGEPSNYVGYLVAASSGTYTSPFIISLKNSELKEISHFSLYGSPSAVPIPAALPLFGTGLGIMGFIGWRRKKQSQAAA